MEKVFWKILEEKGSPMWVCTCIMPDFQRLPSPAVHLFSNFRHFQPLNKIYHAHRAKLFLHLLKIFIQSLIATSKSSYTYIFSSPFNTWPTMIMIPTIIQLATLALQIQLISSLPHATQPLTNTSSPTTPTTTPTISPTLHIETSPALPPLLASKPPPDPYANDPKYNTAYPGPIHEKEMIYYLKKFSPAWLRQNLDIITGTVCLCSAPTTGLTPAKIASYSQWNYYSHYHRTPYALNHVCGPTDAVRVGDNHCWSSATGSDYHGGKPDRDGTYCYFEERDGQRLCVNWVVRGKRWITFHRHKRFFDRENYSSWQARDGEVKDVCTRQCREKFDMEMDERGDHDVNFITTWYPPKPIPWN